MATTYTQEQAKLLGRDYVKAAVTRGSTSVSRRAALAWLRSTYPGYYKRPDEAAYLAGVAEAVVAHVTLFLRD